jgi:hypothetical protein
MMTTVPALKPTATCGMAIMAKASAPGRTKRDWYRRWHSMKPPRGGSWENG